MRYLFYLILLSVIGLPILAAWAAYEAVSQQPLVTGTWSPTARDIKRARAILAEHDPRKLKPGVVRKVTLSERDLNLAANHAINLVNRGFAQAKLREDTLDFASTVTLPSNPLGNYINLELTFRGVGRQGGVLPSLTRLQIGNLSIPSVVAETALGFAWKQFYATKNIDIQVEDVLSEVQIAPGRLALTYRLPENALATLGAALVGPEVQAGLETYHRALASTLGSVSGQTVSMTRLLKPIFALAEQRTQAGGDPIAENRAALVVVGAYLSNRSLERAVPQASTWPALPKAKITLQRRKDFAQHYMTSAALAAMGGGALADAIGLFKEVDDSDGGSGFSFADLAADRAGTRFGEMAVRSQGHARRLQTAASTIQSEAAILPNIRDLPEGLSDAEFKRRFGGVDAPAYRKVTQDIERRLDTIALYR